MVGGGNTAVEEALFLTNFASEVTLIHRRDTLRADKTNQMRFADNPKIDVIWDSAVEEVLGGGEPQGRHRRARCAISRPAPRHTLDADGLFVAIGHSPATELFEGQLDMDDEGYIRTAPDSTRTSVAGVFAAGDVKDKIFRQAVTAAGMGCMAALEAERFLAGGPLNAPTSRRGPRGPVMDWDKLRIFHAVASAGSFTHAGQMLTLSQSAVSRQISALEEEISTPLFQRHARGLTLTDEGELLYAAVATC